MPAGRTSVRRTGVLATAGTLVALLSGCDLGDPGVPCAAVDAFAFTTPEQLGQRSDVVVRGHVTAVGTARDVDSAIVTETFTLAVDDVLGTANGSTGTALAAGTESFVALDVLNPDCPAGATPTPGYIDYPLAGEVPPVGSDVVAFLDEPDDAEDDTAGGLALVLGYALVDGDRATFAAVTGSLRGQTFDVTAIERAARQGLATAGPVG